MGGRRSAGPSPAAQKVRWSREREIGWMTGTRRNVGGNAAASVAPCSKESTKQAPTKVHTPRRGRSSLGANSFIKYCPSCKTVSPSHTHTLPMHTLPFVVANIAVVQFEVPAKKAVRTFYMKLGGGLTTVCLGSVRRHVKNVLFCWSERH